MTIEQIIVQCLYANKRVGLERIGEFILNDDVVITAPDDKEIVLPDNAIQFKYDNTQAADEVLVDLIKTKKGKMRSLAFSDLESFTSLQKELINIGKTLVLPGLGSLQKLDDGKIHFTQGKFAQPQAEHINEGAREKASEEISFKSEAVSKPKGKGILIGTIILVAIIIGAAVYYAMTNTNNSANTSEAVTADTVQNIVDTAALGPLPAATPSTDSSAYKIAIASHKDSAVAYAAMKKLTNYGHNIILIKKDSITYLLTVPIYKNAADTSRLLDSLSRFFGYKTFVVAQ